MDISDGYIGKIIKDTNGIPCVIVGLTLNCTKEVIFVVEYPTLELIGENVIKLMVMDEGCEDITKTCIRYSKARVGLHPHICEEV